MFMTPLEMGQDGNEGHFKSTLSDALLSHDGLMTPVLKRHFGRIFVNENIAIMVDSGYRRHSTVKQWASGYILLDAELEINTEVLPDALVHLLHATSKPFGELLCEFGLKVRLTDITPFRQGRRFGRRHTMRLAETGTALCEVRELMAPERDLRSAAAFYSDGGQTL